MYCCFSFHVFEGKDRHGATGKAGGLTEVERLKAARPFGPSSRAESVSAALDLRSSLPTRSFPRCRNNAGFGCSETMSTIIKWARVAAEACGGWFSIMSGALSVPFAFLALFWASPRFYFAAVAYLAMGASAIGAVRRIHLLVDSHKRELAERRTSCDREKQTIEAQVESLKARLDDRA